MDYALLLLIPVCILSGFLGKHLKTRSLEGRIYTLECDVADLQGKLLIEVKRRAGKERQNGVRIEQEILEAAQKEPPITNLPWWAPHMPGKNV